MGKLKSSIRWDMRTAVIAFFFAGVIGGTVFTNGMKREIEPQFAYLNSIFLSSLSYSSGAGKQLFLLVLRQRALEMAAVWLIGLTSLAGLGFALLGGYLGFSMAVILSVTTMQKGLLGLPVYLVTLCPQWLLYLPVLMVLFFWATEGEKRIRPAATLLLAAVTVFGVFLEIYVNPLLLSLVFTG